MTEIEWAPHIEENEQPLPHVSFAVGLDPRDTSYRSTMEHMLPLVEKNWKNIEQIVLNGYSEVAGTKWRSDRVDIPVILSGKLSSKFSGSKQYIRLELLHSDGRIKDTEHYLSTLIHEFGHGFARPEDTKFVLDTFGNRIPPGISEKDRMEVCNETHVELRWKPIIDRCFDQTTVDRLVNIRKKYYKGRVYSLIDTLSDVERAAIVNLEQRTKYIESYK